MVTARMLPMMANPAVDPMARCALRMPEAIPERSGGIDPMASLVAAATAKPPAAPMNASATRVTHSVPALLAARMPVPIVDGSEPDECRRAGPARSHDPAGDRRQDDRGNRHRQHQHARLLGAVGAHVLEVLGDDEQRSVDAEQRGEDRVDRRVVHPVGEDVHVHHRIVRLDLVAHEQRPAPRGRPRSMPRIGG